jgi:galactosyl transferase GMA12/MNN10 family
MKIAVASVFCGADEFKDACLPCVESVREYCATRGYLRVEQNHFNVDRPISWARIPVMVDLMRNHPDVTHVMWIDADAMITNPKIDLERFAKLMDERKKLALITIDGCSNTNDGVAMFRNDPKVIEVFNRMWVLDEYVQHRWWVNAALIRMLVDAPEFRDMVEIVADPSIFNSYVLGRTPWRFGDFIVHFAGMSNADRKILASSFRTFVNATKNYAPDRSPLERQFGLA